MLTRRHFARSLLQHTKSRNQAPMSRIFISKRSPGSSPPPELPPARGLTTQSQSIPEFPSTIKTAKLATVDYNLLLQNDATEKERLLQAAATQGFMYLKNHRIDPSFLFELAPSVFTLPLSEKMKYDMGTTGYYFGYKPTGSQYVDANGKPDSQEYYNISKDDLLGVSRDKRGHPTVIYEQWRNLEEFATSSHNVATTILRGLGQSLGLDPELLPSLHKIDRASGDHARITWTPATAEKDEITFGGHTDFGSVTLLFNQLGGLQVIQPECTEWSYVKPVPGCAIVNFGDSIVKLLGERILSGMHRVVKAPGSQGLMPRVSVVYFSRPNGNVLLRSLLNSESGKRSLEETPMTADEWIKHRAVHRNTNNYKGKESFIKSQGTEKLDLGL